MIALSLLALAAILLVALTLWRRRSPGALRLIDAYERLNRSVGLAVENGTRLHISLGRGNFITARGGSALAGLAMLRRLCPELHQAIDPTLLSGRVALRAAMPDYLPMAGPLLDSEALLADPPTHRLDPADLPWLDGLYINAGHGAKGLLNAPLCAEMLASALCGEPAPVDSQLLAALDPNRFLLRKMGLKRLVAGLAARP